MEYTNVERQVLSMMQRTDFKNLSKPDVVGIFSQLNQLSPETARCIISQFPEFTDLIKTSMTEYRGMLDAIITSDDKSIERFYSAADKKMDSDAQSRRQSYDMAEKVLDDLSKCLDRPGLTSEEQREILDRELDVLRIVGKKDTEIRASETETMSMVNSKDSEKRQFDWDMLGVAGKVFVAIGLVMGLGIHYKK